MGEGKRTPAEYEREVQRDRSIHRSSRLIGGTPIVEEGPKRRQQKSDISESSDLLNSLKKMGIDPTKPLEDSEQEG